MNQMLDENSLDICINLIFLSQLQVKNFNDDRDLLELY